MNYTFQPGNGRRSTAVLVALLMPLAGCDTRDPVQPRIHAETVHLNARIQTPQDAIAVVRRATKRGGGDPNVCEYHAQQSENEWFVMATIIPDPDEARVGRFPPPGSFTGYRISEDGKIVETMPGL